MTATLVATASYMTIYLLMIDSSPHNGIETYMKSLLIQFLSSIWII